MSMKPPLSFEQFVRQYWNKELYSDHFAEVDRIVKLFGGPTMTTAEWDVCDNPAAMLEAIREKASERKLFLLVAAIERAWHVSGVGNNNSEELKDIATVELVADGKLPRSELRKAVLSYQLPGFDHHDNPYRMAAETSLVHNDLQGVADLLRCIFGNPMRPLELYCSGCGCPCGSDIGQCAQCKAYEVGNVCKSWLTWRFGTVPKIAERIYEERDFAYMPILTDTLEEAGCVNEAILEHCRGNADHARGCWILDLLLGKE